MIRLHWNVLNAGRRVFEPDEQVHDMLLVSVTVLMI